MSILLLSAGAAVFAVKGGGAGWALVVEAAEYVAMARPRRPKTRKAKDRGILWCAES